MLEIFSGLVTGFFNKLINDVRDSIGSSVEAYLLSTHDISTLTARPLTEEPSLQAMFQLTLAMADLLLLLIFTWAFAMTNGFGLPLFEIVVRLAIAVMLVIVAFTYVVRFALLVVLLAAAPLASICMILPETKRYAQSWLRLFLLTVFMQFGQVLVLRFASVFADQIGARPLEALYGVAVLYLLIKVPGLMNASSHFESKAEHVAEGLAKRAIKAGMAIPTARTSSA